MGDWVSAFVGVCRAEVAWHAGVDNFELRLVVVIGGEGDRADHGLAKKPDAIFARVNDINAAYEDAAKEHAQDADGDSDAS